jgi:histidinol-phosphate phosphatase family protein
MIAYVRKDADKKKLPAVFLDRDGTIVHDRPGFYLTDPSKLKLYKSAFKALKAISDLGYRLIVITNQAGVGRGYMTMNMSMAINRKLHGELAKHGIGLDGIYFCPHSPDAGCGCRKPGDGLVKEALKEHNIDLSRSIVIGDKSSDMKLADSLGLLSIMLNTGHGRSELKRLPGLARNRVVKRGILEAAEWIGKQVIL